MANRDDLSVAQLETLLSERREQLESLESKRSDLLEKLEDLDGQIASLKGANGGVSTRSSGASRRPKVTAVRKKPVARKGKGGRATNTKSLKKYIVEALEKEKNGLKVPELIDAVFKAGYKSKSSNFKPVVYTNLHQLKKEDLVDYDKDSKTYKLKA